MASRTLYEDPPISRSPVTGGTPQEDPAERVQKLEEEVFALRDTVSRFAELMLVELKRIKPAEPPPPQPPLTLSVAGMAPVPIAIPTPNAQNMARGWVLPEFLKEITTVFRMYLDPRYRLRRTTQLFLPVILVAFLFNYFVIGALPLLGAVLSKVVDLLLAVLLYKILQREMVRYREVISQYNAAGYHAGETRFINSGEEPSSRMDIEA